MKKNLLLTIALFIIAFASKAQCTATFSKSGMLSGNTYVVTLAATPTVPSSSHFYSWTINNTSAYGQNVTQTLTANGIYTICLTVTDSVSGTFCTYTTCDTLLVSGISTPPPPACVASYFIVADSITPHTYLGYNTSTGTGLTYTWYWGDGTSSTGFAPQHTYAAAGNYALCLVVTSSTCIDSMCATQAIFKKLSDPYSINFVNGATAINDLSSTNNLDIYPNPANDKVYFHLDNNNWSVDIYDISGKKVLSQNVKNNESINTTNLKTGIYFANAKNNNGKVLRTKFTITK